MLSTYMAFYVPKKDLDPQDRSLDYQLGGVGMTVLRVGLGFLVAVGTSFVVEWQYRRHGSKLLAPLAVPGGAAGQAGDAEEHAWKSFQRIWANKEPGRAKLLRAWLAQRVANIAETSLHDFVDITFYLILGAMLAALTRQLLSPQEVASLGENKPILAIVITMALAILLCLCSEADAFVAAAFFVLLRPSAKLAFLTLGPMLDFKLYFMYTRVFKPRLIWTIITCVVIQVFVYSTITHYVHEGWVAHQRAKSVASSP
jgi:hypothetical protein